MGQGAALFQAFVLLGEVWDLREAASWLKTQEGRPWESQGEHRARADAIERGIWGGNHLRLNVH